MKSIFLLLFCFQTFANPSCGKREVANKSYCWLNVSYIQCLGDRLPCECEENSQNYYSITLDTNNLSENFGIALSNFEQIEPFIYPIKQKGQDEYEVLRILGDDTSWAKILVKNDTMFFYANNVLAKFVKAEKCKEFNVLHYTENNVDLLNKSLVARGYPRLESIVKHDSLRFDCNKWMGNKNVLYVKGKPNAWIILIEDEKLQIMEILNVDRDPDEPVKIKK